MVFLWEKIFGINGLINALYFTDAPINWLNTSWSRSIIVFIFLWKNIGFNMIILFAGLKEIPKEYYENAMIEGANAWKKFCQITLIYLTPAMFLAFIMTFINSFRVFREIFMLSGQYPHRTIYMLQHFMYNQFQAINYQRLAASSYIVTAIFVLIVIIFYKMQKRLSKNF
jgi:multiple sugar transport system permease protein